MARRKKPSDLLRDQERPVVVGHELDRETLTPKRHHVNVNAPGDWGRDPLDNGLFRMVPSGDVVDFEESERRLKERRKRLEGFGMPNVKMPTVAEIVKELQAIKREVNWRDVGDSDENFLDVRLQVVPGRTAVVHYGDPGYDTDHHGYWGASSLEESHTDEDLKAIAEDLISQCEESAAQDEEGMPDEDLPNDPEFEGHEHADWLGEVEGEGFEGNDPSGHVERRDKLVVENVTGIAEERGWRLFWWSGKEGDTTAVTESGYATSYPFKTRREAVAYAIRKYGIKPINPPW